MVKVPYFDNAEVEVLSDDYDTADPKAAAALAAFLALTPADRLKDSRHVYAYYQDVREVVGGEDWLDEEMGVPNGPEDIWSYVYPGSIGVWTGHEGDDNTYVFLEANCGWEDEHGLLLVWRNGAVLNKAGSFDGHPTNEHAFDDAAMRDVVYASSSPEHTTRLDA